MIRPLAPGQKIPTDLLLKAYASGVFPMAENASDSEVFWVRPETRGIIPLDSFHVPKSLRKAVRHGIFDIRFDADFAGVIDAMCQRIIDNDLESLLRLPPRQALQQFARKIVAIVEIRMMAERMPGR